PSTLPSIRTSSKRKRHRNHGQCFYASVFDQQQTTHDQFTHMNRLEIAVGGGRKIPKNRG
ncbi:MAG: hypothetical protein WBQ54_03700, partial [Pseudolabrys sp.]